MEGFSSEDASSQRTTAVNESEIEEHGTKESFNVNELVDQKETSLIKERNEMEKEGPRYLPSLLDWMEDNGSVASDPIAENRSVSSVTDTVASESSSWGSFQYADDADDADSGHVPPQPISHEQLLLEDDEDSSGEDEDLFLISSGSGTDTDSETASRRESIGKPPLHPLKPRIQSPSKTSKFEVVDKSSYEESDIEEDGDDGRDDGRDEEEDEEDEEVAEDLDHDSTENNAESDEISDDRSEDSTITDRYLGVYEVDEASYDRQMVFRTKADRDNEEMTHTTNKRLYKPVEERDSPNHTNRTDVCEERFAEDEQEGETREGWDQVREEAECPCQEDTYDVNQLKNVSEHLANAIRPNNDLADVDETSCLEFTYSDEDFEEKCSRQEASIDSPTQNDTNRSVQDPQSDDVRTDGGGLDANDSRYSAMPLTPSAARLVDDQNEKKHSSLIELTYSDEDFEVKSHSSAKKVPTYGANSESGILEQATHMTERNEVDILESHYPSPRLTGQEVQELRGRTGGELDYTDSQYSGVPLTPSTARLINDQNENNKSMTERNEVDILESHYPSPRLTGQEVQERRGSTGGELDYTDSRYSGVPLTPSTARLINDQHENNKSMTERNEVDILESHYPSPRLTGQEVQEHYTSNYADLDTNDSRYSGVPLKPSTARLINDQNENNKSSLIELTYSEEDAEGTDDFSAKKISTYGADCESGIMKQAIRMSDIRMSERNEINKLEAQCPAPLLSDSDVKLISKQAADHRSPALKFTFSDEDSEKSSTQEDRSNSLEVNTDHTNQGMGLMDSSGDGVALQETEIQHEESVVVDEVPEALEKEHLERFLIRMKETARKALHESSLGKEYSKDVPGFDFNDVQQWIRENEKSGKPQNELPAHQERDSQDLLDDSSPNAEQINSSSTPDLVQENSCHDASSDVDDSCTDEISFSRLTHAADAQRTGAFPDFGLSDMHCGEKSREVEALNIEDENEAVAPDLGLDEIHHGESSDSAERANGVLKVQGEYLSIPSGLNPDLGLDEIHHGASPESRERERANKSIKIRGEHLSISSANETAPEKSTTSQSNATFFSNDEQAELKREGSFDLLTAYLESMRNDPDKAAEISAVFANLVDKPKARDPPIVANLVDKPKAKDPPGIRLGSIPESSPTSMESEKDWDEKDYKDNREPSPTSIKFEKQFGGEDYRDDDVTEASFPVLTPKTKKFGNQFPEEIIIEPTILDAAEGIITPKFDSNSAAPNGIQMDFGAHFLPTGNSPNQNDMNTSNLSPDIDRQGSIIESLVSESPFLNENDLYGHNQKSSSSSESPDSDSLLLKNKNTKASDSIQGDVSTKTVSESPLLQKSGGGRVEVEAFGGRSAVRTLYARTGYATVTGIPSKWIVEAAEHEQQYPYPHPLQGETLEANRLQKSANSRHSSKPGVLKKVLHRMHGKKKMSKKSSHQNGARLIL